MTTADTDFSKTYADWLASRVTQQVREGVVEITTPMLDSFNDGMRVFLEHREGATVIHDGGITLETLALRGVDPTKPSARRNTLNRMLAASGAVLAGDRIEVTATTANIPQRIHFLLTAMSRVGDMWAVAKARGSNAEFVDNVCDFLDSKKVLFSTNVSIPGKTVEHPIDIVIPMTRRRERLVRLAWHLTPNTAKVISFCWFDISPTRPKAERVVLINDEGADGPVDVSPQAEAILRGYSTAIYRWSQRKSAAFAAFYEAA